MGFKFCKTAVVILVVMMLGFSVIIHATVTDENQTEATKDAKESADPWTDLAKDKITEGLGLRTEEAARDATIDSAKSTKDEITGEYAVGDATLEKAQSAKDSTASRAKDEVFEKAKESAEYLKDVAYDLAQKAKDGGEHVMNAAYKTSKDGAGYVKDSAYKTAESAKDGVGYVKENAQGAKEGTGYVTEKVRQAAEKAKEGGEDTLEWAKEKANQGFEKAKNMILGSGLYGEEL